METIKLFKPVTAVLTAAVMLFSSATVQDKQTDKVQDATAVVRDFGKMQESIPQQLLEVTQGIIIIPKMINAGLVVGGKRGKGVAMVKDADGKWSNPAFVTLTGGSFGLQAGVQSVDLVLIFKKRATLNNIGKGSFTLGGDISVAAGPVGRSSTANTDYKLEAEVYSYSRSRGLFAGISLNGASLSVDEKANKAFYDNDNSAKEIFISSKTTSASVTDLKAALSALYK
ncbi:lipid-binding SYLF domain-containing protein [Mucilaginibacter sp. HMF5004]|uniref:lipid-binding SYLF domain-containing protein n=1 Tax=Mucilaginibacter rivuli TaxID=2857527 RepID=UPI001C5E6530|nr:lipid-binding SYLF domain-containing protein [Mucilaginibacter rivuli]MBW4889322.1 lipid-binding SYLF domain-containing protein [Mucilaginibacter rivuli]